MLRRPLIACTLLAGLGASLAGQANRADAAGDVIYRLQRQMTPRCRLTPEERYELSGYRRWHPDYAASGRGNYPLGGGVQDYYWTTRGFISPYSQMNGSASQGAGSYMGTSSMNAAPARSGNISAPLPAVPAADTPLPALTE